jgi:hypothetical protein
MKLSGFVNTRVARGGAVNLISRARASWPLEQRLEPQKAHCIVAVANELLKMGGRDVDALIQRELINAAVLAIDSAFPHHAT